MVPPTQISPDVRTFLDDIQAAVGRVDPHAICEGVKRALERLATHPEQLPDEFLATAPEGYARRLLFQCPEQTYSIMVMVWGPGQGTPVHDHAGKWCVECVMQGTIEVISYDPEGDPLADTCRFRELERIEAGVGDVGILVPPNEYHLIRNATDATAVTVHVYEGEMLWCHAYHDQGDGTYRRERRDLQYSD